MEGSSSAVFGRAFLALVISRAVIAALAFLAFGVALMLLAGVARAAVYQVNNTGDTVDATPNDGICADAGGHCTLRAAIETAQSDTMSTGDDTINFSGLTLPATITLSATGAFNVNGAANGKLTIQGPGVSQLTLDGGSSTDGVIAIAGGVVVPSISGLTVTNGQNTSGSCGGICNSGTLTLDGVSVTGNTSSISGSFAGSNGGGIVNFASGTLNVLRSTVSGNTASATSTGTGSQAVGGGIYSQGTLTLDHSTVSGNTVSATGGSASNNAWGAGIDYAGGASKMTTITSSTLSGNTTTATGTGAATNGGGFFQGNSLSPLSVTGSTLTANSAADGANIRISATAPTVSNTILSNPLGGGTNCGASLTSGGYNLEDPGTSCGLTGIGDIQNQDPMLGSLADNGGPTPTHALLTGSPAIDAGNGFGEMTDQRGMPRPSDFASIPNAGGGDGSDIGAFEVQVPPPNLPNLPKPSNAFSFGAITLHKAKGTATLAVELPGAGAVALAGHGLKGASGQTGAAGEVELLVKPKGKTKRKLQDTGKAKVTAQVTYTPTGGDPNTESLKLKLKKR